MGESGAIDQAVFGSLLLSIGRDLEFLNELITAYLDDSSTLLETLHTALDVGDAAEFRRAAHSLKSTSASLGAMAFSAMCKELEDMGKAGVWDGAPAIVSRAEVEYARVRAALTAAAARGEL